ncbi:MAG: hypothetical protein M1518_01905 [Candidatus Thermoplasmatota archaeon]|nr:hypothetical protein [Candidatus Thermoplasmatota archaeon]
MMHSGSSDVKKSRKTIFSIVTLVLVIALASTSFLAGLFYSDYKTILASEPHYTYPQYYIQSLNTSLLRGPFENGDIVGIPVSLSWPAHVYGPLSYDGPVYFFILWSTHSFPSRISNNISDDKNWSIYFLGPVSNATISLSLPPGNYLFCVASTSSSPVTGIAHIIVNYSYFAQ